MSVNDHHYKHHALLCINQKSLWLNLTKNVTLSVKNIGLRVQGLGFRFYRAMIRFVALWMTSIPRPMFDAS